MRKRRQMRLLMVILSIILFLSTMFPSVPSAEANNGSKEATDILNNLTDKQRRALNELEVDTGFTIHPDINITSSEPVKVVVEFKQDPAKVEVAKAKLTKKRSKITISKAKEKVEESHKQFKEELQKLKKTKNISQNKSELKITHEFRNAFNGVAMALPGNAVEDLLRTGVVKRIWKDEKVQLDLPKVKGKEIEPKMADSIPQIGVDKLHDEDIKGQGIKVGVIDTGIDYKHPDLQEVYAGYRATEDEDPSTIDPNDVKGWDFIDNDADPMETTYKEWQESGQPEFSANGSSYYTSHGTHVSGTVAGQKDNDVDYAVKGVAPEVDLYNYRVLGPYGSGATSGVIAGIDKAVKDEMNVINLSLGSNVNDPLSPSSVAINNAMLSGVVTVVTAGNAGPGEKTVGSPGAAAFAISVGASDVSQTIPTFTALSDEDTYKDVKLLAKNFKANLEDLQDQSYPVVFVGLGTNGDFEGKDLTGKIALIERGEITFDEKIKNAKQSGAEAAIVYNNEAGQIPYFIGENTAYIPSFRLSKEDGEKLKEGLSEETVFTFGELRNTKTVGDHLADFSSRGPVAQNYDIKPDVVAPGVAIYSTVPSYINDPEGKDYDLAYSRLQGTSMASPHVAGTAALILQENPDYTPFDVKAALMNTAVDLQEDYAVYEVGAGRINAYDAVHATTSIKIFDQTEMLEGDQTVVIDEITGSIGFGSHYLAEGEDLKDSRNVVIENRSKEEKSYTTEVEFLQAKDNREDASENGVELDVPDSITVSAENTEEMKASIKVSENAAFGTYEGYIHIINSNNKEDSYQIPFAIRVTDKGIDYAELDRPAVTNDWTFHPFLVPFIDMVLKLKSPMETIDVIVKDSETNEPIGFVGTIDGSRFEADKEYFLLRAFMGSVYPFTEDPSQPISDELVDLPEGDYTFELIASDEQGEIYSVESVVVVDNTPAEFTFNDYEPGVIEVDESMYTDEDGHHALWVHTNVYDSTIDLLNSKGMDYDQSENIVAYYQNSPFPGILPVDANGKMKFGVLPEEIENGPLNLDLMPVDLSTSADMINQTKYTFVKKGTAYGLPTYDKEEVRLGDTVTMTLSLNNVEKFLSGEFEVEYERNLFKFDSVKVNEAFKAYAKENDLEVSLDEPTFREEYWTDIVNVGASIEENDFKGFDGDIDFLDVTFELIGDEYYGGTKQLSFHDFSYMKAGATEPTSISVFSHDTFTITPKHSTVTGFINPEAFLHEDGFLLNLDYEEIGVKVYAKSHDGKVYQGSIENGGAFTIKGLPVTEEAYDIIVEAPGHLSSKLTTKIGEVSNGEMIGERLRVYPDLSYAGDVNDDGLIDIHDVMRVVAQYGKENKKVDINYDGVVDETDIRFIEKNFLKIGPDAPKNKEPRDKLGKKGLNDFLQALGLEPMS